MNEREAWLRQRIRTILVATDFYQNSRLALAYAAGLARRFGGNVTLLNAFQFGPYSPTVEMIDHVPSRERTDAEEMLQEFSLGAGLHDLTVNKLLVEGLVPSAILKALYAMETDLLVIGTEGIHKGLGHLLLGSNTEALMLGAHRPTLTVGPLVPDLAGQELSCKKVLYIADLSVASIAAASFAAALGEAFGAEIEVFQLVSKALLEDPQKLRHSVAQYCDLLAFADPDLPKQWFDVEFQISRIIAEAELESEASRAGNLLVLGVQAASFIQRHLHTSLAYRLLATAHSPVLTVPAEVLVPKSKKGLSPAVTL